MRVATLQFSPRVGEVESNIEQANSLLDAAEMEGRLNGLDLLVLPEMAFSGYNFKSLADITPFLEPTAAGVSTLWAMKTAHRLKCIVAVGYPELSTSSPQLSPATVVGLEVEASSATNTATSYNSLVFVNPQCEIIAHHRKAFLYYTDDTWAKEGPDGFYHGSLPLGSGGASVTVAAGICMDINPYKFEAPYTAYEFANHCRDVMAKVVVVSMAWLTRKSHAEMYGGEGFDSVRVRRAPDMDTVGYWIERFSPLLGVGGSTDEVIIIFANRAGEEGEAPLIGEVRYAGSSSVMGMTRASQVGETNVRIWKMMGRAQNGLLVVDTSQPPLYTVKSRAPAQQLASDDEDEEENCDQAEAEAEDQVL